MWYVVPPPIVLAVRARPRSRARQEGEVTDRTYRTNTTYVTSDAASTIAAGRRVEKQAVGCNKVGGRCRAPGLLAMTVRFLGRHRL